jgi:tetratricopeptide (TPR) repeat protein
LRKEGHSQAAEAMAGDVLRAEPRNVDAMALLIEFAKARGDHDAVEQLARSALSVRPNDRYFTAVVAESAFQRADPARAIRECDRALALFPGDEAFIRIKALSHEVRQEFAEALAVVEPLLGGAGCSAEVRAIAGRILHGLRRFDEAIACMRPAAEDQQQPAAARQRLWFQLAKTYDRVQSYEHAMEAAANAHALSTGAFDSAAFDSFVEELIDVFSASNLRLLARATVRSELPVFVVGMPRSGTTLLEQIIHAHPSGFGAGELPDIEICAKSIQLATDSLHAFPQNVVDMSVSVADRFASQYLARMAGLGGAATRVVNKMLEQDRYVGLIWMILPGARIIHIRRDPLDTCLSCYTRHLNHQRMSYARSLENLGFVYRQHERLMDHWKSALDLPILTVQYEELVADQQRVSRQVIEFLGLPWDDRCLRYWESDRTAMTLSYDQVNKPIYDSSIGRWRNYQKHLGPLKQALANPL